MNDAAMTEPMKSEASAIAEEVPVLNDADVIDNEGQDDDDYEEEEENIYVVSKIVDVKAYKKEMILRFKVRWEGFTSANDTWETEDNLCEEPCVEQQVRKYKEDYKEKVAAEQAKLTAMPRKRKSTKKPTWEYVEVPEEKNKTSLSQEQPTDDMVTPRELCETDEFYGETAGAVKGEVKKLFDPTHKNTPTELVLAQMNTNERVTRRQMRNLISTASSRSNSIGRDSSSPAPTPIPATPSPSALQDGPSTSAGKTRGRPRKLKPPPPLKITKKRSIADVNDIYDDEVTAEVHIDDGKPLEGTSPSPIGDIGPSTSISRDRVANEEQMDIATSNSPQIEYSNEASQSPADEEPEEDLLAGLQLHEGPVDLTRIQNDYHSMMLATRKRLNSKDFRYGRDIINLLSNNDFDVYVIEELFESLSTAQLQSIFSWTDATTGHNLLHWVCYNLKCNGCHSADKIVNILCTFCIDEYNRHDAPVHLTRQIDALGNLPLHIAVEKGQLCRASHLLMQRSSVNFWNKKQQTPLSIAYGSNHAKMVKLLLHYGADFSALEKQELMKREDKRKKRAFEVIANHSKVLRKLFVDSRKKVLGDFEEVPEYKSIIHIARFCEGPSFTFHLPHEHFVLPSDDYAYVISLHVCRFAGDDPHQWTARCGAGLAQQNAPVFNGKVLMHEFAQYLKHPMFYYVDPIPGKNVLDITISLREMHLDIIGCQLLLIRRLPEHHMDEPMTSSSGLEVAPLVGIL